MSHKYPQQVTDDPSRGTTGSEHSSMYSTSSYGKLRKQNDKTK